MGRKPAYFALALAAAGLFPCPAGLRAADALTIVKRANGPEIVLDRRAGSGVVCVMAAVGAGSVFETPETRGASHLVEHMVFDGSERYTREEISGWIDDAGGFLNAFTRRETTVYFLLVPSARLEKGIEILSQMLLHSILPAVELEKERKVILEEIRRETDDPRSARERAVERILFRGSGLAEPVIGYPATVETMSGAAVRAYYRKYYTPSNMRIVLTGGFDPEKAKRLIGEYFPVDCARSGGISESGAVRPEKPVFPLAGSGDPCGGRVPVPTWSNEVAEERSAGGAPGLDLLVPFPPVAAGEFPTALLVSRMLESGGSLLARKLEALSLPAPEVSLETYRGFSALRIHVGAIEGAREAYLKVPAAIESLAEWVPGEKEFEAASVSFLSSEMFDREMYHFYVMSRGEAIALHGERYLSQCAAVARVTAKDCARFAAKAFRPLVFNGCLMRDEQSEAGPALESLLPMIERLPNGCTVAAISRPGSPVAALHLMFRGRACVEGGPPNGLAEMLVTLLESSAAWRVLAERLDALGARVQFGDNPYVPQDDYLLNPSFAFIRLEAPAQSMREASRLLVAHLLGSATTGEDLDAAKKSLAREVGMRSASPYYTMRGTMMEALLGSHPFAGPIFPSTGPMMRVSLEELIALRERLFAGRNTIATLVSPETPAQGCGVLKELLAGMPEGAAAQCPQLPDPPKGGSIEKGIRKEGAYIAAGWLARRPEPSGVASLVVAGEVLSRRMQLELREKQGLSYSIECSVAPLPGGATVLAYLGTGVQRIEEARASLEREVRGLGERPPDAAEVEIAKNRLLGRRSRSELSSINAAYALGFDLLLCGRFPYQPMNSLIAAVTAADVRGAIEAALAWDRSVVLRLMPEAPQGR